jgi:hypothetical protein
MISWHGKCTVVKNPPNPRYDGWGCDGRHHFRGCVGGGQGDRWYCSSHGFDLCVYCTKISVFADKIIAGEFKKSSEFAPKIVEVDYKLKNFLDAFSRGICWLLGQTAYKLIVMKKPT